MADNPAITPDPQPRKPVPFVGWSRAAARFRELATTHAPGGNVSVLLLGAIGAGKATMARVWQDVARHDGLTLPIVNLDDDKATVFHLCIAISARQLPKNMKCLDLESWDFRVFPKEDSTAEARFEGLVKQFQVSLRLYMPPLRTRPADILALLHFFNCHILPAELGCSYETVSSLLLDAIIAAPWNANGLDLLTFLLVSAKEDLGDRSQLNPSTSISLGNLGVARGLDKVTESKHRPQPTIREELERGEIPDTSEWRLRSKSPEFRNYAQTLSWDKYAIAFSKLPTFAVQSYVFECFPLLTPSGWPLEVSNQVIWNLALTASFAFWLMSVRQNVPVHMCSNADVLLILPYNITIR